MSKSILLIIIALIAFAGVVIVINLGGVPATPELIGQETVSEGVPSAETEGTQSPPTSPLSPKTPAPKTPAVTGTSQASFLVIAPQAGEKLIIGQNYTIKWSKESGFPGFIYLADAATKEVMGWINSEIGPHQTSYAWNARDLFITRYNPNKNTVAIGKYVIGIGFDSRQAPATSGVFEIIYPSQATADTYDITIKNFYASPSSLVVKKGSKLIFLNQDSVVHKILSGGIAFSVAPGESYTFDTAALFPGPHEFYSEKYSSAKVSVIVQ